MESPKSPNATPGQGHIVTSAYQPPRSQCAGSHHSHGRNDPKTELAASATLHLFHDVDSDRLDVNAAGLELVSYAFALGV